MLIHALQSNAIDGALVCRTRIRNGKVRAEFEMARTPEEILSARRSKYVETRFLAEALPLIQEFQGRLAVVGLPCDLTALKRVAARDIEKPTQ